MNAPFASGSNAPDAMVVIPCSMGTLGRIAHGYSEDVLLRAADVVLKEKKKLILVPRETPLNLVHVRNFELLLLAGATILPANPCFYTRPANRRASGGHRGGAGAGPPGDPAAPGAALERGEGLSVAACCSPERNGAAFVRFSHTVFALPFALAAMAVAARREPRLAGLAQVSADPGRHGLRPHLRHGVQPDRGSQVRRAQPADGRPASAGGPDQPGPAPWRSARYRRLGLVAASFFLNPLCFYLSPVALAGHLLLLADQAVHGLHPCLPRPRAGAGADRRLAGGARARMLPAWKLLQMLVLAVAVVLWLVGFDIIYALQDYEFDRCARPALAGGGVGAQERAPGRVPGAPAHVRAAAGCSACCAGSGSPT